mmetsp:Transcript_54146/g.125982  ORF Transcript_54146/g.125982 Transcript_54146/m.125982 type:complete len:247 (+) Transcript_54146:32-772(+)
MATSVRNTVLVSALRERLAKGLQELAACRALLELHKIPHSSTFSARPQDHTDVLEPQVPLSPEQSSSSSSSTAGGDGLGELPRPAVSSAPEEVAPRADASEAGIAPQEGCQEAAGAVLDAPDMEAEVRKRENLEEELSMAKALLMLNNVSLHLDLDQDRAEATSAAEVVRLKGNRHLIQLLITLQQKVSLLNQQYLLLRGDMMYLSHEMSVCRHWILQSFRTAMQQQSNEHTSLQTRFERLSKVLN